MKITVKDIEKNTIKIIDTPLTLLQYAKINTCGIFQLKKESSNKIILIDPFSKSAAFEFIKGGVPCL